MVGLPAIHCSHLIWGSWSLPGAVRRADCNVGSTLSGLKVWFMANLNYSNNKPKFNSRAAGLAGVIIFHALLIYGLISGLAQTVVQVIQKKVDVAIISEPPPPPPPPPPPKIEKVVKEQAPVPQPKEAYVPPPVNPPPVTQAPQNAIAATTADPTPPPPVTPAPPPPPAVPAGPVSAKANCSQLTSPAYPSKAEEDEVQGVVRVVFSIGASGKFESIQKISFDHIPPRYQNAFNSSVTAALKGYTCKQNALMEQEFAFRLNE